MTTRLDKTLKRELQIGDRPYIVTISPLTLKLTPKGRRKGLELSWEGLVNGDAGLAAALNASVGKLAPDPPRRDEGRHPQPAAEIDEPGEAATRRSDYASRAKTEPR